MENTKALEVANGHPAIIEAKELGYTYDEPYPTIADMCRDIRNLRTQLAERDAQLAALDTGQHHIGYSVPNKCWFVRMYGFKTEDEAKTALHYLTTPRLVPSDCVEATRQPTQDKGGE